MSGLAPCVLGWSQPLLFVELKLSASCRFGTVALFCLVALRMGTGWHFYKEGVKKLRDPDFTADFFLRQAKGPLTGLFHSLIPDRYGRERLDQEELLDDWKEFRQRVEQRLSFDESQRKRSQQVLDRRQRQLIQYLADHRDDFEKFFFEVDRLEAARSGALRDVGFQQQWILKKQAELWNTPTAWLSDVRGMSQAYQDELLELASDAQSRASITPLVAPAGKTWVDHAVTWVVLGVGILLLLGLFTRAAALAGAGFLCSVLATQPFWVAGSELSYAYYQFVELLVLFLLAATAAGRFWGLDFFMGLLWARIRPPREVDDD